MSDAMLKGMLQALLSECLTGIAPRNATRARRTYIRTYKEQLTLREHLPLSNARRGAARFPCQRSRTASASRGGIEKR